MLGGKRWLTVGLAGLVILVTTVQATPISGETSEELEDRPLVELAFDWCQEERCSLDDVTRDVVDGAPASSIHDGAQLVDRDGDGQRELFLVDDVAPEPVDDPAEPSWFASDGCGNPAPCARTPSLTADPVAASPAGAASWSLAEEASMSLRFIVDRSFASTFTTPTDPGPLVQLDFDQRVLTDALPGSEPEVVVTYQPFGTNSLPTQEETCGSLHLPAALVATATQGAYEGWHPFVSMDPDCKLQLAPGAYTVVWTVGPDEADLGDQPPEPTGYEQAVLLDSIEVSLTGNFR